MSTIQENVSGCNSVEGTSHGDQHRLLSTGYEVIPIKGKFPRYENWTLGGIPSERLTEWQTNHPDHKSTGIRTGRFAVADIDLWNADHAETVSGVVQKALGETLLKRIGAKGCALCYYTSDPIRKITVVGLPPGKSKLEKVEFLGTGQQLAAFGIHPDTGEAYRWIGASPLDFALDNLPEVTPEGIRKAAFAVYHTFIKLGYTRVAVTGGGMQDHMSTATRRDLTPVAPEWLVKMFNTVSKDGRIIGQDQDRVEWIGWMCVWKYTPLVDAKTGEEVDDFERFEAFNSWCAEEGPNGYLRGNYTDDKTPNGYESCLEAWLSMSDVDRRADGKTIASLVKLAKEYGYDGPTFFNDVPAVPDTPAIERIIGAGQGDGSAIDETASDVPDVDAPEGHPVFGRWEGAAMTLADAMKDYGRPEFLVYPMVRATGVNAILAFRGIGKTLVMVDMAMRGTLNMDWHGFPMIKDLYHFMFASEDTDGTVAHIIAWCKHHDVDFKDRERFKRFILIPEKYRPNLNSTPDCEKLAKYLKSILPAGAKGVLWVDTWQSVTVGVSQKDDEAMGHAMRNGDGLAKAVNGCVVAAYHTPKTRQDTITGAGQLEDAGFSIVLCEKIEDISGYIKVSSTRIKGARVGESMRFKIDGVEIGGKNAHGVPFEGAVLIAKSGRALVNAMNRDDTERLAYANVIRHNMELNQNKGKKWSVDAGAKLLEGKSFEVDGEEVDMPSLRTIKDRLVGMVPYRFPGEDMVLDLVETGKVVAKKPVREFKLRIAETDIEEIEIEEPATSEGESDQKEGQ